MKHTVEVADEMKFHDVENMVERVRSKLEVDIERHIIATEPQSERELPPS